AQEAAELSRVSTSPLLRAHSSTAERPAHNRTGLGSNPGGPTVLEREDGSHRGWPAVEGRGCVPRSTVPALSAVPMLATGSVLATGSALSTVPVLAGSMRSAGAAGGSGAALISFRCY